MRIMTSVLVATISFFSLLNRSTGQELAKRFGPPLNANSIELTLTTEKHKYKRDDDISFNVMVSNKNLRDIFIYGNLEWGYYASLTLCVQDARGKTISPNFSPDAITFFENPDDISQFVKLLPFHFLGKEYKTSTARLNIQKPGRYSIYAEYHSPISKAKVNVKPFFGKEDGIIPSNTIFINVE